MVTGLDKFREHFASFSDRYVLIGGVASWIAMDELGAKFRATQDLDIVLSIEALDKAFAEHFWKFVKLGGYQSRQKSTGKRLFYRFHRPKDPAYPVEMELFSRVPDAIELKGSPEITPIPTDEETSSLSAILMDDGYYKLIHASKRKSNGIMIVGAECLIPLKAQAYVDLRARKEAGEKVDSKKVKKHMRDIFRLYTVIDPSNKPILVDQIKQDVSNAFTILRSENVILKDLGVYDVTVEEVISELEEFYELGH